MGVVANGKSELFSGQRDIKSKPHRNPTVIDTHHLLYIEHYCGNTKWREGRLLLCYPTLTMCRLCLALLDCSRVLGRMQRLGLRCVVIKGAIQQWSFKMRNNACQHTGGDSMQQDEPVHRLKDMSQTYTEDLVWNDQFSKTIVYSGRLWMKPRRAHSGIYLGCVDLLVVL